MQEKPIISNRSCNPLPIMSLLALKGTEALLHRVGEELIGWKDQCREQNVDFRPSYQHMRLTCQAIWNNLQELSSAEDNTEHDESSDESGDVRVNYFFFFLKKRGKTLVWSDI